MNRPVLYDYARSSAAYRVRIALNLKGVDYERRSINLVESEQTSEAYRAVNPQGLVPALEIDGQLLTQSLAIIVYLDQRFREPPLMPAHIAEQAQVRALSLAVACDIHPLNNLRVLRYLKNDLGVDEEAKNAWYRHWLRAGFDALEAMAAARAGRFLFGDRLSLADVVLVPQMFNARRFDVPVDDYPTLLRADENARAIEAIAAAHPDAAA